MIAFLIVPPLINRAFAPDFDKVGGTRLVYEVDQMNAPASWEMDKLVRVLTLRLDPAGNAGVKVRALGDNRVEILIPKIDDPVRLSAIKERITIVGLLEFRIIANERHDAFAIRQARQMLEDNEEPAAPSYYEWVELADPGSFGPQGRSPDESVAVQDRLVLTKLPDETQQVTGDDIALAGVTQDQRLLPAIAIHLTTFGTRKFARLTRSHQPEPDGFQFRLAIILDRKVMSAPVINSPIEGGDAIIEGGQNGFTQQEVGNLVAVLNATRLPVTLLPDPVEGSQIPAKR